MLVNCPIWHFIRSSTLLRGCAYYVGVQEIDWTPSVEQVRATRATLPCMRNTRQLFLKYLFRFVFEVRHC